MRKRIAEIFVVANYLLLGFCCLYFAVPLIDACGVMLFLGVVNGGLLLYLNFERKQSSNLVAVNARRLIRLNYPHAKWFRKLAALCGGILVFEGFLISALPLFVLLGLTPALGLMLSLLMFWAHVSLQYLAPIKVVVLLVMQLIFFVPSIFANSLFERALMGYHVRKLRKKLLTCEDWQDQAAALEQLVTIELYRKNFSAADAHTKRLNFLNDVE